MEGSKYAKELREVGLMGNEVYKKKEIKESRTGLETLGKYRMGNETRANEHWRKKEDKKCRLCNKDWETLKHVLEECSETGRNEVNWRIQMNGDKKSISKLSGINWIRKRKKNGARNIENAKDEVKGM